MTQPVSYLELNTPDIKASTAFFEHVFGWAPKRFAFDDYLVAPHGETPGIDTGLLVSRDGEPRSVPVIRVDNIDDAVALVREHGGAVVVPPFEFSGVGRGCYISDPAGLLIGLHSNPGPSLEPDPES